MTRQVRRATWITSGAAAALGLGLAGVAASLAPLALAGTALIVICWRSAPDRRARLGAIAAIYVTATAVRYAWLHATIGAFLDVSRPAQAAYFVAAIVGIALANHAITLGWLAVDAATANDSAPAGLVLVLNALLSDWIAESAWLAVPLGKTLDVGWAYTPVLRAVGWLGWAPTTALLVGGSALVGHAFAQRDGRVALPTLAWLGLAALPALPRVDPPASVGVVYQARADAPIRPPAGLSALVWPEGSLREVLYLPEGPADGAVRVDEVPRQAGTHHLVNALSRWGDVDYNAVVALDSTGGVRHLRAKSVRVHVAEFAWLGIGPGRYTRGQAPPELTLGDHQVAGALCFEAWSRRVLARRAPVDWIAILANDLPLGDSGVARTQAVGAAVLRAVERGAPAVRSSLGGPALLVASDGTVVARHEGGDGVLLSRAR